MTGTRAVVYEILARGEDDWVMAAEVAWIAKSVGGAQTDREVREVSLDALQEVLDTGVMRIGTVTDGGFLRWDGTVDEWVRRVKEDWKRLDRLPEMGELFWLERTSDDRDPSATTATDPAPR